MTAARTKKLTKSEVELLIQEPLQLGAITHDALLEFVERVNGSELKQPPKPKAKAMTITTVKKAVLQKSDYKTVA